MMLTPYEICFAFFAATHSVAGARSRWNIDARDGCTDDQLADRLRYELSSVGGWLTHAGVEPVVYRVIVVFQRRSRLRFSNSS